VKLALAFALAIAPAAVNAQQYQWLPNAPEHTVRPSRCEAAIISPSGRATRGPCHEVAFTESPAGTHASEATVNIHFRTETRSGHVTATYIIMRRDQGRSMLPVIAIGLSGDRVERTVINVDPAGRGETNSCTYTANGLLQCSGVASLGLGRSYGFVHSAVVR
jgi:hypothetical protein